MPCSCTLGFEGCAQPVVCRCFVCDAWLCEDCSRLVVTREGNVRICNCSASCLYALQVRAARAVAS